MYPKKSKSEKVLGKNDLRTTGTRKFNLEFLLTSVRIHISHISPKVNTEKK